MPSIILKYNFVPRSHDPRGNACCDALRRVSEDAGVGRLYYHIERGNKISVPTERDCVKSVKPRVSEGPRVFDMGAKFSRISFNLKHPVTRYARQPGFSHNLRPWERGCEDMIGL